MPDTKKTIQANKKLTYKYESSSSGQRRQRSALSRQRTSNETLALRPKVPKYGHARATSTYLGAAASWTWPSSWPCRSPQPTGAPEAGSRPASSGPARPFLGARVDPVPLGAHPCAPPPRAGAVPGGGYSHRVGYGRKSSVNSGCVDGRN